MFGTGIANALDPSNAAFLIAANATRSKSILRLKAGQSSVKAKIDSAKAFGPASDAAAALLSPNSFAIPKKKKVKSGNTGASSGSAQQDGGSDLAGASRFTDRSGPSEGSKRRYNMDTVHLTAEMKAVLGTTDNATGHLKVSPLIANMMFTPGEFLPSASVVTV